MAGDEAVKRLASSDPELPERMCEECFEAYKSLTDLAAPCSRASCSNTWRWSRFEQLVSRARGHNRPPRRLCSDCEKDLAKVEDKQMPCRMRGCEGTWVWTRKQQLTWEKERPPARLCETCFQRLRQFEDKEFPCRVRGCDGSWVWSAYQQLEHEISGKSAEKPPHRMCIDCISRLRALQDRQLPCKAKECSREWTWSAYAQLEHLRAGKSMEEEPSLLCRECFDFYRQAQDVERPCKIKGCRNSWIYGKGWQLRDWLKGREHPPAMMCSDCRDKLAKLQPVEMPCSVSGCDQTWTYSPADQLKDTVSGRREPRTKRCQDCETFLRDHSFENLKCEQCGCDIPWSPFEQLMVEKGTFKKPSLCSSCAEGNLPAAQQNGTTMAEHHLVIRVPKGGRWGSDPQIAAWPPHVDHEGIARAEKADVRIVALGDDLTWSAENREESWPWLLEQRLNQRLADSQVTVAVVNAGIPGTNSRQALLRLKRDVVPFRPDIVLLSFAYGDSKLEPTADGYRESLPEADAEDHAKRLMHELVKLGTKLIYWTTNPMFPQERQLKGRRTDWAAAQETRKSRILAHALHVCAELAVPVLELRARFEVNGKTSARKWMSDWLNHNLAGANNIATWMASELINGYLPNED